VWNIARLEHASKVAHAHACPQTPLDVTGRPGQDAPPSSCCHRWLLVSSSQWQHEVAQLAHPVYAPELGIQAHAFTNGLLVLLMRLLPEFAELLLQACYLFLGLIIFSLLQAQHCLQAPKLSQHAHSVIRWGTLPALAKQRWSSPLQAARSRLPRPLRLPSLLSQTPQVLLVDQGRPAGASPPGP